MVDYVTIIGIAIAIVLLLILAELLHLFKIKKKPATSGRLVVPAPSQISKVPKPSIGKYLGSRSSPQELTREAIRRRVTEKHIDDSFKKEKLANKIKEIKERKLNQKVNVMELARETTEFSKLKNEKLEAEENENPEIFKSTEDIPSSNADKFNKLLISIYNDINTGMVSDAKNHYSELLILYNSLVDKVANKEELYAAVKDVREALMAVLK